MAYIVMHRYGAFAIVPDDGDASDSTTTAFIQTDWDYPSVASAMGWSPCPCGSTDGTVDCDHRTASEMIAEAHAFIEAHAGECFSALDDYLPSPHDLQN